MGGGAPTTLAIFYCKNISKTPTTLAIFYCKNISKAPATTPCRDVIAASPQWIRSVIVTGRPGVAAFDLGMVVGLGGVLGAPYGLSAFGRGPGLGAQDLGLVVGVGGRGPAARVWLRLAPKPWGVVYPSTPLSADCDFS